MKTLTTVSFLIAQLCAVFVLQKNTRGQGSSHLQALSDGVQEAWVRHYASGLLPGDDEAIAVAIDNLGNVYVTGKSESSGTNADYATIKYNSAGVAQWVARYDGPGNDSDIATALAVDASGNVYVTGRSWGSGTGWDYATIKYNSTGVEQWVARYDGPGNAYDIATALAIDTEGNVYVTGWSSSLATGTSDDYATIKYNSAGVEQWVARYNGPESFRDRASALAVDAEGNVFVTGESASSIGSDYATIKYNGAGVEQWVARYNGPENSGDRATALAVDASGNVYVTGSSGGSGTGGDYAAIKYNSAGIEQWVTRYDGESGNGPDIAKALAVDASGNVYVTGQSWGSLGRDFDYATIMYNSAGVEQWVTRYNGPGESDDLAIALAVDAQGNVYVTGTSLSLDSGFNTDFATIKYNSAGIEQWSARYNGSGNSGNGATF